MLVTVRSLDQIYKGKAPPNLYSLDDAQVGTAGGGAPRAAHRGLKLLHQSVYANFKGTTF